MSKPRLHGTRARYVFGAGENDVQGQPCRCDDCKAANRAAENQRNRQILYGRWQPYTDAEPVREHLRALSECGLGGKRVIALTGISSGVISKLLYGGPGDRPPTRRVRPETAERILAVQPSPETLGGRALVDATATRRRVQALVAVGYPLSAVAARLGKTVQNFSPALDGPQVTAATARAVYALYDELWDVPPDESAHRAKISASRARNMARAKSWPPPMAWDDETIGDPAAGPAEGWQRKGRLRPAEVAEEARELLRFACGPEDEHAREPVAERLGMRRDTLDTVLARDARKAGAA
jgi:hypothetical protein